jgi:hypothetical protein
MENISSDEWMPASTPPDTNRIVQVKTKIQNMLAFYEPLAGYGPKLWWGYSFIRLIDESEIIGWREHNHG